MQAVDLDLLEEALPRFLRAAREHDVFTFVDSDLKFSKPEVRVTLDREKAQGVGISALDIAQTLQASLSGQRFGYFIHKGKQYDVIGQLTRDFRSRPDDLGNIAVRRLDGRQMVRLDNLVSIQESSSPPELYRYNRYSAATVSGTLAAGRTLAEGIAAFDAIARETLDERFTTSLSGAARDFEESASSLGWVFVLALVLIYLVLAAQFESFVDPLVILLTVPLALAGALFALWYFDQTLNIFSQIGLIMLVGLVTKNGILIVEFANQRLAAGAPTAVVAVREAAAARLRPILMTTLATVLGSAAHRARARRRRGKPHVDGHRRDRRARVRRCADAVRDSRDVRADAPACGLECRGRRWSGYGSGIGVCGANGRRTLRRARPCSTGSYCCRRSR